MFQGRKVTEENGRISSLSSNRTAEILVVSPVKIKDNNRGRKTLSPDFGTQADFPAMQFEDEDEDENGADDNVEDDDDVEVDDVEVDDNADDYEDAADLLVVNAAEAGTQADFCPIDDDVVEEGADRRRSESSRKSERTRKVKSFGEGWTT